jgi:drug/metabolite transporter (DMT)-like permease
VVTALYALLVLVWSSTWVAIKFGLEDCPPLLGAGLRFGAAGLLLLAIAVLRRSPLRTDWRLAGVLALFPFALAYGLVYWGEQSIPSGLAAVLFGALPLYTALLGSVVLPDAPLRRHVVAGIAVAIAGLALAFAETAGSALAGTAALALAPVAGSVGAVSIKRRGGRPDAVVLNGWGMLGGGVALLCASALSERWAGARWTAESLASIAYLAVIGSALAFVAMTVLLLHVSAQSVSFIYLLLPFGALAFGAALYGEALSARAVAGAALVSLGLLVARRVPA